MKKYTLILALGLLANLAFAQPKDDQQLTADFDKILSAQFKPDEPGATALVARNGQIIYKKAFGMANLELNVPMQADHVFKIGSITKQFTAVAILQLMEQGKLNVQDDITKFIPDYPTHGYTITIEHLLTHTSGIQSYTSMPGFEERMTTAVTPVEMIQHFRNQPMRFAPGTRWSYSNSNYFLLGYIIEQITGQSYSAYLEENFFKPLGMMNSFYGSDIRIIKNRAAGYAAGEKGFENARPMSMTQPYAAGSILSTVEDLLKWNRGLQSYKLIKKESLDKAYTRYKLSDGTETDYGYGWRMQYVQDSPTIEHGGGINGFITMVMYLPKEDVFVAVFSNCECYSPEDLAARLAAITIGKSYEYKEIPVAVNVLQGYTGVYENAKGEQRIITVAENQLYSQRGRNPKFLVRAYETDRFFFEGALLTIHFSRSKKGAIEKLTTHGRAGTEVWTKTNKPIPVLVEIKVNETILETYVGEYEMSPEFSFKVSRVQDSLFVQVAGQERFQIYAETETKFFSKIDDSQFEFIKDDSGKVISVILNEGGKQAEARKIN